MATQIQFRRGTTAENNAFTGALAEITVDTTLSVVRVHDGSTVGGFQLIGANSAQNLNNKTFGTTTFSPNISVLQSLFVGSTANTTTYSNPTLVIKAANTSSSSYIQAAMVNSTSSGASRWTAYADNGSDLNGWTAIGTTGSTFANASYTITGKNDGFIFSNGISGYGGNLIIATGPGGGANSDIIFGANGFTSTDEKFRYVSSTNSLRPYGNLAMSLGTTTNWYGNLYSGNASISTLTAGTFSVTNFNVAGPITLNSSGNVSAIINGGSNGVGNIGSSIAQFNTIYATAAQLTGNVTLGNIINAGANGSGNIGSSVSGFNTVFAKATSAQYADLAEYYSSDSVYPPGTVVDFGGPAEVTLSTKDMSTKVAGVISTEPGFLMNSVWDGGGKVVALALAGRVPCLVKGNISAGDMMVSAGNGYARAESSPKIGSVIGKALSNFTGNSGVIEVVVGRL
jgi:hypothetical protein